MARERRENQKWDKSTDEIYRNDDVQFSFGLKERPERQNLSTPSTVGKIKIPAFSLDVTSFVR
jgi:hypothetical protein